MDQFTTCDKAVSLYKNFKNSYSFSGNYLSRSTKMSSTTKEAKEAHYAELKNVTDWNPALHVFNLTVPSMSREVLNIYIYNIPVYGLQQPKYILYTSEE